ncbi:hypothetical protein Droror1_Dr00018370 [Drosera rotundifolia]
MLPPNINNTDEKSSSPSLPSSSSQAFRSTSPSSPSSHSAKTTTPTESLWKIINQTIKHPVKSRRNRSYYGEIQIEDEDFLRIPAPNSHNLTKRMERREKGVKREEIESEEG